MSSSDAELKLALDALDARLVPAAAPGWDERLLALLEAEQEAGARPISLRPQPRPPVTRRRLRLLLAACLVLAALIVFFASGAAARIGIPNPIDWLRPGNGGSQVAPPSPSPSSSASNSQAQAKPTPGRTQDARPTSTPTPSATPTPTPLPSSWGSGESGAVSVLAPRRTGTRMDLRAVDFVGDRGWAVGQNGTILASADGGATWAVQPSEHSDWLFGVSFADASHGWAVGGAYGASILATSDGGGSWTPQPTTLTTLQAVSAVDAAHAWAVGDGVLATTDGATWTRQTVPLTGGPLLDVCAADLHHVWAVGHGGTIVTTSDGGETWRSQDVGGDATLTSMCFIDADHGWVAGYTGGGIWSVRVHPARDLGRWSDLGASRDRRPRHVARVHRLRRRGPRLGEREVPEERAVSRDHGRRGQLEGLGRPPATRAGLDRRGGRLVGVRGG